MKSQRLIITLSVLTLVFVPQSFRSASAQTKKEKASYHAELISPTAGQILVPGQVVRVEWKSNLPAIEPSLCETEIGLSLDGGRTFEWVTGERDPRVKYFDWTVPNTPSNAAVLDIHFGCLGYYPETASHQMQSVFVISKPPAK